MGKFGVLKADTAALRMHRDVIKTTLRMNDAGARKLNTRPISSVWVMHKNASDRLNLRNKVNSVWHRSNDMSTSMNAVATMGFRVDFKITDNSI